MNNSTAAFSCMVLPFCDTSYCDSTVSWNPATCDKCNPATIAILFVVLFFLGLFIMFGNLGIIVVIIKTPSFHNPFNLFKSSLAVADLLVGVLVIPSALVEMFVVLFVPYSGGEGIAYENYTINGTVETIRPKTDQELLHIDSLCARLERENTSVHGQFFSIVGVLSIMASIFNLVLLSVDRFLAVFTPIKYNQGRAINNRVAFMLIVIVWVICVILATVVPAVMGPRYFSYGLTPPMIFTFEVKDGDAGFFYTLFAVAVPYIMLLAMNVGTGAMLFRKWAKIKEKTAGNPKLQRTLSKSNSNNSNNIRHRNEVRATVTLLVMILTFSISTIPSLIFLMLFYEDTRKGSFTAGYQEQILYLVMILLLISNSAWNFLIYSWRNENFRKAMKHLWNKLRRRQGEKWQTNWKRNTSSSTDSSRLQIRKKWLKKFKRKKTTQEDKERRIHVTTINGTGSSKEKCNKTSPESKDNADRGSKINKDSETAESENSNLIMEKKPVLHGSDSIYTSRTTVRTTSTTLPTPEPVISANGALDSERMFFGIEEADVEASESQEDDSEGNEEENANLQDDDDDNEGY